MKTTLNITSKINRANECFVKSIALNFRVIESTVKIAEHLANVEQLIKK
jgi:hypothetical protein